MRPAQHLAPDVQAMKSAGELLWSAPKVPGPPMQSTAGALIGMDQKQVYVCGDYLQAIKLEEPGDGKPVRGAREWSWDPQTATGSVGYAAQAGDRIYVPVSGAIQVFNAADGKPLATLNTGKALDDSTGFASLVVLDKMLLVSTRDRVIAFGPQ